MVCGELDRNDASILPPFPQKYTSTPSRHFLQGDRFKEVGEMDREVDSTKGPASRPVFVMLSMSREWNKRGGN